MLVVMKHIKALLPGLKSHMHMALVFGKCVHTGLGEITESKYMDRHRTRKSVGSTKVLHTDKNFRGIDSLRNANLIKGTLTALAAFSEGNQVDKVKSAALLSPIVYVSHIRTALGNLAAKANFLKVLCANPGVDCYDLITEMTGHSVKMEKGRLVINNIESIQNLKKCEMQSTTVII